MKMKKINRKEEKRNVLEVNKSRNYDGKIIV
jgi:hypothetical protein